MAGIAVIALAYAVVRAMQVGLYAYGTDEDDPNHGAILQLARATGVDAPIAEHVDAVVRGEISARDMMDAFIARDTKAERD